MEVYVLIKTTSDGDHDVENVYNGYPTLAALYKYMFECVTEENDEDATEFSQELYDYQYVSAYDSHYCLNVFEMEEV